MTNSQRASYIRGLMDGLELDPKAKETKLFNAMVELLDDLCSSVEEMEEAFDELADQVDEIDEDLGEMEEDYYGDDCDCASSDCCSDSEIEITCPKCSKSMELTDEMLEKEIIECPSCGTKLEIEFDEDEHKDCDCNKVESEA